jgi:alpha-tubulin suppressor-like RCC1 family protein
MKVNKLTNMKGARLKYKILFTLCILFSALKINAQNYFWIGGTGNWSDTTHWSNKTGGLDSTAIFYSTPPTLGSKVIFDTNSFLTATDTVYFDVERTDIVSMKWLNSANGSTFIPRFQSSSTDSLFIARSLFLDVNMDHAFSGKYFFTSGNNDTIQSSGQSFLNDIRITNFGDTITFSDDFTSTAGIYLDRGGLNLTNRTVNCSFFRSNKSTARQLLVNNTIFNLFGQDTVLLFKPNLLSKIGVNEVFNINDTSGDMVEVSMGGSTFLWNELVLNNLKTRFISSAYFSTLINSTNELVEISIGTEIKSSNFNLNGTCGKYLNLKGISTSSSTINNNNSAATFNYCKLSNIKIVGIGGNSATNSLNLGNNTNITVSEDTTPTNYFWVLGKGAYQDPGHWSLTSGGIPDLCIPGPNDLIYFDSLSGNPDSLFITESIIIGAADFSGITSALLLVGLNESFTVRVKLSGSTFLSFNWAGSFILESSALIDIQSNGTIWNNNMYCQGTGTKTFSDDYLNLKNVYHRQGGLTAIAISFSVFSFNANQDTLTRNINFSNSNVVITGTHFTLNHTITSFNATSSHLLFTNAQNQFVEFNSGNYTYDTVTVQTSNIQFISPSTSINVLTVEPGSTVTFDNNSNHNFNFITANGTCTEPILFKSSTSNGLAATLHKNANTLTEFTNLILDHVNADSIGTYVVFNPILLNNPQNWTAANSLTSIIVNLGSVNLAAGSSTTLSSALTYPVAPSYVVSSVLNLTGVSTTADADIDTCAISLHGITSTTIAPYVAYDSLTGPSGAASGLSFSFNTTISSSDILVELDVLNGNVDSGNFIINDANLIVNYYDQYTTPAPVTYYWYGDGGDWTDINHWSLNSGNVPAAPASCIPTFKDNVVFNDLSFTAANETVQVDKESYVNKIIWTALVQPATFMVEKNLTTFGDVQFSSSLSVLRTNKNSRFVFQPINSTSNFNPNSAFIDVPIVLLAPDTLGILNLQDDLITTDSTIIIIGGGKLITNDNNLRAGTFFIGSDNKKTIHFGSSTIELHYGFKEDPLSTNLTLFAGTSSIIINHATSDTVYNNYFTSNGHTFYDVALNFNPNNYSPLSGNNNFHDFKVGKGSKIEVAAFSLQSVSDSIIMRGTCADSIYFISSVANTTFTLHNSINADSVECLFVNGSINTGQPITAYFSTDGGYSNTSWIFNNLPATTSALSGLSNFCFGDTLQFTNVSTAFYGIPSVSWDFGDSDTLTGDTTQHYYSLPGNYDIRLIAQSDNFCRDTLITQVKILNPSVTLNTNEPDTTICFGNSVEFYASAQSDTLVTYQYFANGIPINMIPTFGLDTLQTNTLNHADTISVKVFEIGCEATSNQYVFTVHPLPNPIMISNVGTTICSGDSVQLFGTGADLYQFYKNGVAITPFNNDTLFLTNITHLDTFHVVGRYNATLCINTSPFLIFTVNDLPSVTLTDDDSLSNTLCAGSVMSWYATSASGTNYSFLINDTVLIDSSSNTWSWNGLNQGDIATVIVSDIFGCISPPSNALFYTVNAIPNPILVADTSTICEGNTINFTGSGVSNYSFLVNDSVVAGPSGANYYSSNTLTNLDEVKIFGTQNNCPALSNIIIINATPSPVTSLSSDIGNTVCQDQIPVFTATSSTAISFEFFVNGISQFPASLVNQFTPASTLSNGSIVKVKGYFNSCEAEDQINLVVNPIPLPTIYTLYSGDTICQGSPLSIIGTGGASYAFYVNGINQGITSNTLNTDTLVPGNNTTWVTVTNSFNCSANSDSLDLFIVGLPTVNLSSNAPSNTACFGNSVTFTATTGADQYQFFLNSNSLGLPSSSNTFTTTALNNGDSLFVIAYNNGCPKTGLDTIVMTVNSNPTATLTGTNTFCAGSSQIFTAGTGTTYEFLLNTLSLGSPSSTNTFDGSTISAGNHTLQVVVHQNTCSSSSALNLTVLTTPTVNITGVNTICSNTTTLFQATGASTYEFYLNGTPINSSNIYSTNTLNDGDVVSLIGESLAGCFSTNSVQITMTVNQTPTTTLVSDDLDGILCNGQSVIFTASGATNYEFFVNGNSTGIASTTATFATSTLTNGQTVSVTGSSNACFNSQTLPSFPVVIYPIVNLTNASDTSLCTAENTQLTASGASDYQFLVNGAPQGAFSPVATFNSPLSNGNIVTVSGMTNTCAALANTSIQYSVFTYPTTTLSSSAINNTICLGDTIILTGTGASNYSFFIDNVPVGNGSATYSTNELKDGQIVSLISSNEQCSTTANPNLIFTVNTLDLASTVTPTNYMICSGEPVSIQTSGADEYELFVNGISQGAQGPNNTFNLPSLTNLDEITFNGYSNTTGCLQKDNETFYIHVSDAPTISINQSTVICEGDSTILTGNSAYGNQWLLNGTPITNANDTSFVVLNSGDYSLSVTKGGNGEVWSQGYNGNGEIGNGTNFNSNIPSAALSINSISTIQSGSDHSMALLTNGALYVWGKNLSGQFGNGTYTSSNSPLLLASLPSIKAIAAGNKFSIAASTSGNLFSWGNNNEGQLGLGNNNVFNTPQLVASQTNVKDVTAGVNHALILKNDSTVWSTGNNDFGQLGVGTLISSSTYSQISSLTGIVAIEAGEYHSMAVDAQGNLFVWGNNTSGQLGLNDLNNKISPVASPLKKVLSVSGGHSHTLVLIDDGSVYSMGSNTYGQLGTNNTNTHISPIKVANINAIQTISAGQYHSLLLKKDGTVLAAGRNNEKAINGSINTIIDSFEIVAYLDGVTLLDGGNGVSHYIFGNNKNCVSSILPITVNAAPQPILFYTNGDISTTTNNVFSFEWFINGVPILNSDTSAWTPISTGYYTVLVTYSNGCTRLSEAYAWNIVGLNEDVSLKIALFPNPTDGIIQVEWNISGYYSHYTLLDMTGRNISSNIISEELQKLQLDLQDKEPGLYHLVLQNNAGKSTMFKIIKN